MRKLSLLAATAISGAMGASLHAAPFIDTMDDATHLSPMPADITVTTSAGQLTATRSTNGWNGFWWNQTASDGWGTSSGAFSMSSVDQQGSMQLDVSSISIDRVEVWIHFYDASGNHVGGEQKLPAITTAGVHTFEVASVLAVDNAGATQWRPDLLIVGDSGESVTFNTLAAVPEPASLGLIGLGGIATMRRRRN